MQGSPSFWVMVKLHRYRSSLMILRLAVKWLTGYSSGSACLSELCLTLLTNLLWSEWVFSNAQLDDLLITDMLLAAYWRPEICPHPKQTFMHIMRVHTHTCAHACMYACTDSHPLTLRQRDCTKPIWSHTPCDGMWCFWFRTCTVTSDGIGADLGRGCCDWVLASWAGGNLLRTGTVAGFRPGQGMQSIQSALSS